MSNLSKISEELCLPQNYEFSPSHTSTILLGWIVLSPLQTDAAFYSFIQFNLCHIYTGHFNVLFCYFIFLFNFIWFSVLHQNLFCMVTIKILVSYLVSWMFLPPNICHKEIGQFWRKATPYSHCEPKEGAGKVCTFLDGVWNCIQLVLHKHIKVLIKNRTFHQQLLLLSEHN